MIPLKDDVPSRTFPFVNIGLIVLNALFFLLELGMGENLDGFLYQAAVVPVLYTGHNHSLGPLEILLGSVSPDLGLRVLLSLFLHGGWMHLLGNMLYLWIFGDNVEDRMGHGRYLVFYLLCGWAATFAHIWASPASRLPSIGASGAIAGVLGAYVSLYPRARVVTVIPLGIFFPLVRVPGRPLPRLLVPPAVPVGNAQPGGAGGRSGGRRLVGPHRRLRRGVRPGGALPASPAKARRPRRLVGRVGIADTGASAFDTDGTVS